MNTYDRHIGKAPASRASLVLVLFAAVLAACAPAVGSAPNPTAPATEAMPTTVPSPTQATPIMVAPKAYIGLFKDNTVAVLDTGSNRVLTTIPVPPGPHGLVITPDGRSVYVSSDGDSKVSVIDTTTDKVKTTIEVGKTPHGLAITPDGRQVLVAVFGTSMVAFIDTASNQVTGQVGVPNPHNIAISPDGHTAYVGAQAPGAAGLVVLDVTQKTQTGKIPLDKAPRALNFSPDGKELYFTQAGIDAVQVLDPASNKVVAQVPVGASPHHPLFTPDGKAALVVVQGPGQLAIITPANHGVSATVTVGKQPHWIAVTADSRTAYVTNEGSNDVSVVDIVTGKVTATIPVGNAPRKIVIQTGLPATGQGEFKTQISGFAFTPTIIVTPGQRVTWTNADAVPHTVTSADGLWDSGEIPSGKSFTLTLTKPGTYAYHCSIHPYMQGAILVRG